jgi:signal transduction histidine kinase
MSLAGNLGVNKVSVFVTSHGKKQLECIYSLGVGIKLDIESINVNGTFFKWLKGEISPAPIDNIYTGKYAELLEKQDWLEKIVRAGFAYVCPLNFGTSLTGLLFFSGRVNGKGFDKYAKEVLNIFLRIGSMAFKNMFDFKSVIKASGERESFSVVKSKLMNHRSFELNTPLTVLKSTLWSIESDAVSEVLMLDMARDAVKYLEGGVSELAGISEINFDGIGLQLGRADISAIVEEYLQKTIPEIEEKHISVIFNEKIYREAMVDRVKIKIAVGEIIDNAVRFLSEGGNLEITVAVYETDPNEMMEGVELKCWDDGGNIDPLPKQKEMDKRSEQVEFIDILEKQLRDITVGSWIVLRIKDNGVGISEKEVEEIAQPFRKGSNSGNTGAARMGVGLSLAQKIISDHGGKLFCRSTEGKGTEFSLWIPTGF